MYKRQILFRERQRNLKAQLDRIDAEKVKLTKTIDATTADVEIQEKLLPDLWKRYETQRELKSRKSAATSQDILEARIGYFTAKRQMEASKNSISELRQDWQVKDKEAKQTTATIREAIANQLVTLTQELKATEEEIIKVSHMDKLLELRVPTDSGHNEFVVFEVAKRSVGSVLREGEPLFRLIPIDVPLEAEVEIAGKDVAKLRAITEQEIVDGKIPNGSKVKLKLSAFDYQDHGTLDGFVRAVSEGVYEQEGQSQAPANYRARIKILPDSKLENVDTNFRLLPGMATTAEIKVGRRRVLDYILYPVLRYLDEGLREP